MAGSVAASVARGAKKKDHATGAASIATPMSLGDSGWMWPWDVGGYYSTPPEMISRPKRGRGTRVRRWFSRVKSKKVFSIPNKGVCFSTGRFWGSNQSAPVF